MHHCKAPKAYHLTECNAEQSWNTGSGSFFNTFHLVSRLALTLVLLIVIPTNARAFSTKEFTTDDPDEPWHISADKIDYDQKASTYTGIGNVSISKANKRLTADYVHFDNKTMQAVATGHAMMTAGEDVLMGSRIDIDLEAETGTIYNGTLFFKENNFHIKGDTLRKTGKNTYTAENVSITTCNGDKPAWKITGKNLKVAIEGYGTVRHAALRVKNVPVLYSPFLTFPVKSKRQSGLLLPQAGYDQTKGIQFIQPFYWAINESSDATFYWHHMQDRGEKLGAEYRYVLDPGSKGIAMVDFLDDRKVDDGSPGSGDYGYDGDAYLRPNSDRYWFRAKANQSLPWKVTAKLDLDIVSDQDYLYEFRGGYTGFNETEANFLDNFGRDLDTYDDPIRSNSLNFNRRWDRFSLNAEGRWQDNVAARRQGGPDPTIQRLPTITFDASKQYISTTPFLYDLTSGYNYFYIDDGDRAHRLDIYPRFYLPYRFKNYFTFEPSLGLRETVWHYDKNEYGYSNKDTLSREMYDVKMDLYSKIFNVFPVNGKQIERIKHAVKPQVVYYYTPDEDQAEYPNFDTIDRIQKENLLTYTLTNTFTSKSKKETAAIISAKEDKSAELPVYTYNEACRFKLGQSYDINKERDGDPEPFSPVFGRLDLVLSRLFSLGADANWSPYDGDFVSHNIAADIKDKRGDRLYVEHRYTQDAIESIYADLLIQLTDRVMAYAEFERNLKDDRHIRSGFAVVYTAQCWSVEFGYEYENSKKIGFMIHLFGFGEFGTPSIIQRRVQYSSKRI
ncbi:MAG: LPS-assembly protein LptD [Deltaproteobacteria bacterium]|nr:LPS-assembly protein LptD [Deltaproteobacteria bacterium]